jgi:SAM-dependent methyltransferase
MCGNGHLDQLLLGRRLDRRQGLWPRRKPGIATSIYRCRQCSLIYPNPMPVPACVAQHYDVEPEQYWRESYFQADPTYLQSQIRMLLKLSGRPAGGRVLDIGAGIGKAMIALERAGFDAEGVEPSAAFRQAAIERMGVSGARLHLASIEDAAFPENSFDFINFAAVLEHLVDPARVLSKIVTWLKPDGLMYVEVPSSAFLLSRLVRVFYRLTGADYVINTCPMHVPYHLYEFGLESFRRHGRRAAYSLVFHEYYPCGAYMPKVLIGPANSVMRWTNTGMQLAVWLRKAPGDRRPDEEQKNDKGFDTP